MLESWIKKAGLGILILILSVTMNEVYGRNLHASIQVESKYSNERLEKSKSFFKTSLNLEEALKSNITSIRRFKILESDILLAKKVFLVKKSKVKRKSHKLGKANVSHLLLNYHAEISEERNYSIPYRETVNLEGYQRVYDCWYTIEITPD